MPESPAAIPAAEHLDDVQTHLFLESLAGRGVPPRLAERTRHLTDWAFVEPGDEKVTGAPLDWLGVNYYSVARVAAAPPGGGDDASAFPGAPPLVFVPRPPMTEMGWEIEPSGLIEALDLAHQALPGVDLWVTENGAATRETDDGSRVHDPERIDYLRRHLAALLQGRAAGLPIRGYYVWSLMDNLEWSFGWTKRFGIVRVEQSRLERRPKDSAWWLRQTLASRIQT
jgi:beta-glucosidase